MSDFHARLRTLLFMVPFVYRHRGVPLDELAKRLGVDESKLVKEIDFLLMIGKPPFAPDDLVDIHVDGGRVFVELPSSLEHPPRFSVYEALALACAGQLFAFSNDLGEAQTALRIALQKVLASLPAENRELFDELAERYLVLSGSGTPHLELLRQAQDEAREVELTYFTASRNEVTQRVVRPVELSHHSGVWYLVAWCTEREAMRIFRLSRIREASLTDRIFEPEDVAGDIQNLRQALGAPGRGEREVVIEFSAEAARWVEERWEEHHLHREGDGRLSVTLYDVSDEYVLSYTASFGGDARIVRPPELAEKYRQQVRAAVAAYE